MAIIYMFDNVSLTNS